MGIGEGGCSTEFSRKIENYYKLLRLYYKINTLQPPDFQGPGVRWSIVVLRSPARRTVLPPSCGDPSPNAVGLGRYGCTYG